MTNLPATTVEAEARLFAHTRLAELVDIDLFELGVPTFHPQAGEIWLRRALKAIASSHPTNMMWVIEHARVGWDDAEAALRELAIEIMDRGERLPTALAAYTMELIGGRPPRLPGPRRTTHVFQDILIACLLSDLVERFSLKPTRSSEQRICACDIVVGVINEAGIGRPIQYKAVEKLWTRWGRWLLPDRPKN